MYLKGEQDAANQFECVCRSMKWTKTIYSTTFCHLDTFKIDLQLGSVLTIVF